MRSGIAESCADHAVTAETGKQDDEKLLLRRICSSNRSALLTARVHVLRVLTK